MAPGTVGVPVVRVTTKTMLDANTGATVTVSPPLRGAGPPPGTHFVRKVVKTSLTEVPCREQT